MFIAPTQTHSLRHRTLFLHHPIIPLFLSLLHTLLLIHRLQKNETQHFKLWKKNAGPYLTKYKLWNKPISNKSNKHACSKEKRRWKNVINHNFIQHDIQTLVLVKLIINMIPSKSLPNLKRYKRNVAKMPSTTLWLFLMK